MDGIILKKCTEEDADILRSLLAETFSDTFASMNTPEDMELYLNQAVLSPVSGRQTGGMPQTQ